MGYLTSADFHTVDESQTPQALRVRATRDNS